MQKINWENGTVVKEATVTVDGIEYEISPREIDGNTPLSASNLNLMQENIEDAIEDISTDYITETGTNYIKYDSGKMICWDSYTGTVNVTSSAGGVYYATYLFTFPVEFISTPVVTPSVTQGSGVLWACLGNASSQTTTTTQLRVIAGASTSNASVTFRYIAIGKWK